MKLWHIYWELNRTQTHTLGDTREKDNLNTVDSPNIEFKHIIILNVIILVKDNILYIVLLNASLYFNVIGKYNVLYLIQSLNQIECDEYSLRIEMKTKKKT